MLRLYHSADARSFRCLWAIHEMNLACDLRVMRFPPRIADPDYLAINPQGTVPALVDGDLIMTESVAILQYLVTRYGPTSLGVSPEEDGYGQWLDWLHYGESTLTAPQTVVIRYRTHPDDLQRFPTIQQDYCEMFLDRVARLEAALADRDFLCCDRFTIADISVGYALDVANYIGLAGRLPGLVKQYIDRLRARPGYRAARRAQAIASAAPPAAGAR